MADRVVITGMGLVSPMGHDVQTTWNGILTGKNGFGKTTIFDASTYPTKFCAEVKNYDLSKHIKNADLHKDSSRGSTFVLGAAVEACKQAGIDTETDQPTDNIDRTKMGIYLGAGEGGVDEKNFFQAIVDGISNSDDFDSAKWTETAAANFDALTELEQEPSMPVSHLALLTGTRGPVRSCLTACAASTQAVGEAFKLIQRGDADIMIAGGAHSMIHMLGITGFNRLTALSTNNDQWETASRPFTASRDGFVIGEGGAVVILETLTSAKKRGANILAEVTGFGSSSDAFRVTDMHEDARGAVSAINSALSDANINAQDVEYVSTHGTSTSENDSIETRALKTALGQHAYNTPVSSVKSMMGHLIGAAGCAELITCICALNDGVLPHTANHNDPDPDLDLDYIPNEPRKKDITVAMNESFGFGGQNNVVIIRKFQE